MLPRCRLRLAAAAALALHGGRLRRRRHRRRPPACTSPGSTPVSGGTAVLAEPPSTTPKYIFPYTSSADFSDINTVRLPVPDVPAAVLVRPERPADGERLAEPGQPADVQRQQGHDHAEALHVVRTAPR